MLAKPNDLVIDEHVQIEPLHVENENFEFVEFEPMNNNDT
jgi:hypothetical protein